MESSFVLRSESTLPCLWLPHAKKRGALSISRQQEKTLAEILGLEGGHVALVDVGEHELIMDRLKIINTLPDEGLTKETKDDEGKVTERITYAKKDVLEALDKADVNDDAVVTRAEWKAHTTHTWPPIWLWPAGLAAVVCLLFFLAGREAKAEEEPAEGEAPTAEAGPDAEAAQAFPPAEEMGEEL